MGFLNNFLTNLRNKIAGKKELPEPQENSVKPLNYQEKEEEDLLENYGNIYSEPSQSSIHRNIRARQSYTLSFLMDMAYVAATADNSFYIAHPFKVHHSGKKAIEYEEQYKSNLAFSDEYFRKSIKLSHKLDQHVASRQELYEYIKEVYPDFCHNMETKVSPEDFDFYKQNKIKLKRCLSHQEGYSDEAPLKDVLLNYQDSLAELIDTLDFSKACKIEDQFVLSELNTFFEKYSELTPEEQAELAKKKIVIKQNNGKNKIRVLTFAQQLKEERESRIEKFASIEELYNKLDKQSSLKLKITPTAEENTKHIIPRDLDSNDDAR